MSEEQLDRREQLMAAMEAAQEQQAQLRGGYQRRVLPIPGCPNTILSFVLIRGSELSPRVKRFCLCTSSAAVVTAFLVALGFNN